MKPKKNESGYLSLFLFDKTVKFFLKKGEIIIELNGNNERLETKRDELKEYFCNDNIGLSCKVRIG